MFVGRGEELSALNDLYNKNSFQLAVIYGRRRMGKTTLIKQFVSDKPAIFFAAQEANERLNLQLFSGHVYNFFNLPQSTGTFADWYDAFSFIADKAITERFILVIDEFPYIASQNKSVGSILQNIIDHRLKDTNIYIILCGSHIGFMEKDVLGYKSPLFGRRTAQLQIREFDYIDCGEMLTGASREDIIKYFACVGGTPHYLWQIDKSLSFEKNIIEMYFKPHGYLFAEPMMLLKQELREPAVYNSVISAVATGAGKLNEISVKIGEETSKAAKYIKTLVDLQILRREVPFGENPERSRKALYQISDNCYRFWYRYVFLNRGAIETDTGKAVAESMVLPEISAFIGKPAFEDICRRYLIRKSKNNSLPFLATRFGTWWGTDNNSRRPADIDVVADNSWQKCVLLCECKWKNADTDASEIQKLIAKKSLLPGYSEYHFMFFSKSNFTESAIKFADKHDNLSLVTLDMLFDDIWEN